MNFIKWVKGALFGAAFAGSLASSSGAVSVKFDEDWTKEDIEYRQETWKPLNNTEIQGLSEVVTLLNDFSRLCETAHREIKTTKQRIEKGRPKVTIHGQHDKEKRHLSGRIDTFLKYKYPKIVAELELKLKHPKTHELARAQLQELAEIKIIIERLNKLYTDEIERTGRIIEELLSQN